MALHWDWSEKCGEITLVQKHEGEEDREFTLSLYTGNAVLIMLNEWEENGEKYWSMASFFADKEHMKNCLGLNKKKGGGENIFDTPYNKFTKVKLNKKKCRYFKDIVAAFTQAFDNLIIEVFSE